MGTPELPLPDGLVLRPFRGVRFAVEDPAKVTSPPYDLISEADVDALLDSHPNNVVRLILPRAPRGDSPAQRSSAYRQEETEPPLSGRIPTDTTPRHPSIDAEPTAASQAAPPHHAPPPPTEATVENRYTEARDTLKAWLDSGVLVPDEVPALYVYEQSGRGVLQRGLIGDVGLADPGQRIILPHEDVVPGPIADRLALMSTTQANLEPIFLLYDGDHGTATRLVDEVASNRPPLVSAHTEDGLTHHLWAITDTSEIDAINADLHNRQALIADGHHRYATYRVLQRQEHATHHRAQIKPPTDATTPKPTQPSPSTTTPQTPPSPPHIATPGGVPGAEGTGAGLGGDAGRAAAGTDGSNGAFRSIGASGAAGGFGGIGAARDATPERSAIERPRAGGAVPEPTGTGDTALERAAAGGAAPEPAETEDTAPEPAGTGNAASERAIPEPTGAGGAAPESAEGEDAGAGAAAAGRVGGEGSGGGGSSAEETKPAVGPWDFGLALLVDSTAYPPNLQAIHRVIPGLPLADAAARAKGSWRVRDFDDLAEGLAALEEAPEPAFLLAGEGGSHLLTDPDPMQLARSMPPDHSERWNSLNTSVLTEFVLPKVWGMRDDEQAVRIVHHDTDAAVRLAIRTGGTAVLLKPLEVDDVLAVAAGGERVPRKSTSFGPKPRTGLVLRTFAID
ncbi:DUF1015 domain-containing protein [Nonomuraea sp. NPDC049784]|uniref:DUF1015 domain-containing protein n=1 Tax=Nonomuraea sp. NPDC049784 TaxID=3154361 RepID=UPI003405A7EB